MGKWKKLTAFAPALAAVIVAACAGISLNGYTAPVYAVEQPEALGDTGAGTGYRCSGKER